MPLHNWWSNMSVYWLKEGLSHAWSEGFSVVIRIPQRGSVCIFIYIYISVLFGTGADFSFLEHFTSDLYHLCPYSKLCCRYWLDIMFQRLIFVRIVDFNSLISCQQTSTGRHTDGTFKESYNSKIFYWSEIGGKVRLWQSQMTSPSPHSRKGYRFKLASTHFECFKISRASWKLNSFQ